MLFCCCYFVFEATRTETWKAKKMLLGEPWIQRCVLLGQYHTLMVELEKEYKWNIFGAVEWVGPRIQKCTHWDYRQPFEPGLKLAIALRYLYGLILVLKVHHDPEIILKCWPCECWCVKDQHVFGGCVWHCMMYICNIVSLYLNIYNYARNSTSGLQTGNKDYYYYNYLAFNKPLWQLLSMYLCHAAKLTALSQRSSKHIKK